MDCKKLKFCYEFQDEKRERLNPCTIRRGAYVPERIHLKLTTFQGTLLKRISGEEVVGRQDHTLTRTV